MSRSVLALAVVTVVFAVVMAGCSQPGTSRTQSEIVGMTPMAHVDGGGCACRTADTGTSLLSIVLLFAIGLGFGARRRRRP